MTTNGVRLHWLDRGAWVPPPASTLRLKRRGKSPVTLIQGDNLTALHALRARQEPGFALAYMDPPFLTGKQHSRITRGRDADGNLIRSLSPAFDDRWDGLSDYLGALGPRIAATRELLADHGSFVLHVDSKTSHYCKVLCDEIFGPECFASEIIWRYRRWPAKTKNFQRVHDVLLRYTRRHDVDARFNQLYEPLAPSTLATWGTRKQRAVVDEQGRRTRSSKTQSETPGAPMGDVWEIGIVAPVSKERTGYPTQKPEPLLERLILACTDEGDAVLDPYMGSATTLAVAARLGRSAVGIDAGLEAFDVAYQRLSKQGLSPRVEDLVRPRKAAPRQEEKLLQTG